jgi:hypothetical protein
MVPMTTRRLREWPRMIAAVTVVAVLLVLVGVLVASTGSGATRTVSAKPAAAVARAAPPSRAQKHEIAELQARLKRQSAELAAARSALGASRARTRCWRSKARHPRKERAVRCPTGPLISP